MQIRNDSNLWERPNESHDLSLAGPLETSNRSTLPSTECATYHNKQANLFGFCPLPLESICVRKLLTPLRRHLIISFRLELPPLGAPTRSHKWSVLGRKATTQNANKPQSDRVMTFSQFCTGWWPSSIKTMSVRLAEVPKAFGVGPCAT
jgi:hypothetical protein